VDHRLGEGTEGSGALGGSGSSLGPDELLVLEVLGLKDLMLIITRQEGASQDKKKTNIPGRTWKVPRMAVATKSVLGQFLAQSCTYTHGGG